MSLSARISVIVPVYKVESYLNKCVDSIINQSYPNLDIILVDDGSPDRCPEICEEYAEIDSRIKVIHKKNGGLSDARNAGLDAATGDYVGFVDSDDWISRTMYEELLSAAERFHAEITCCGFERIDDATGASLAVKRFGPERQASGLFMLKEILSHDSENVVVWNKLYRSSVFSKVRFPYGEYHEDNAVLFQTVGKADIVAYTGAIGYYYRVRTGSIMKSGAAARHHEALARDIKLAEEYVRDFHPELKAEMRCYQAGLTISILKFYMEEKDGSGKPIIKELRKQLASNLLIYLKSGVSVLCKLEALLVYLRIYKPVHDLWIALRQYRFKRLCDG